MRTTDILLKQPGLFSRVFQIFNSKDRFLVGYDLEGNRFLERASSEPGARTKRTVEYAGKLDHISDAIGRNRNLSVQWKAWLSHTRVEAPTIQELESDLRRRRELYQAVQNIQMREDEEIARMEAARQATMASLPPPALFPSSHATSSLPAPAEPDLTVGSQQTEYVRPAAGSVASTVPGYVKLGGSPVRLDPTPETDPLRLESQRALQQQQEEQENRGTPGGERPVAGTRVEGEWKPEGWSPSVSRRRG